jgi:hypothetical protein
MENMLQAHQIFHASVETTVGAPLSRRASEEDLLPAHQATGCAGDKAEPGRGKSENQDTPYRRCTTMLVRRL